MNIPLRMIITSITLACFLTFTGCHEISTTTRIHPDGSCERIVEIRQDSTDVKSVFTDVFPTPVDSTWMFEQAKDTTNEGGKQQFIYTARNRFNSVSDLNRALNTANDTTYHVTIEAGLRRRFRWFNTFLEYRETYKACTPFNAVPISNYLTHNELSLFYIKEDTLGLDKKVDQWLARSSSEELYGVLLQSAMTIPDSTLTPEMIRARKDSLFAAIDDHFDFDKSDNQKEILFLEGFYHTQAVRKWSTPIEQALNDIQKKQEFLMNLDGNSYVNRVVMPGLILDSNAPTIEGNTAVWKPEGSRFFWEDYTMRVESRVVNRWAMWVTGGLLLAAGVLVFVVIRR